MQRRSERAQPRTVAQNSQDDFVLGPNALRVLREHHDTAGEHQQTDYLEQH